MVNVHLNTDDDQERDQSIIKYPKISGRGNLSLLMWPQTSAQKNQENMDTYKI